MKIKTKTFTTGSEKCQREVHLIWTKLWVKKKNPHSKIFFLNHEPAPLGCLKFKLDYMTDIEICKKSDHFFTLVVNIHWVLGGGKHKTSLKKTLTIKCQRFSSPLKVSLKLKIAKHIF